ncbi:neub family protein with antifreeze-like domains, putative [Heliomicrobium modesticaldum Ice1]|uniref:Neub family protein with antifreeze-like domains, putative n=1 Tax=Heliobacterium modesticaldum (strain ATCC 51547 / Ice1) TaxID=498761 RepID=B0TH07_HELMI|nr:N-acetylneuraminate synthase family protein [Heliomicrobium modesticaldum]ABZ83332.1 neub family protein with antifreeze-like domains, putative [Heliomicrobium modesticaldum Ice1]
MTQAFSVSGRMIGDEAPPLIVAEMSGNHNGSLERALQIVEAAAKAGAHAFKIQTYRADTMTLDVDQGNFRIDDQESLWSGKTLYELYAEAYTPWEWHRPILERCRELGMIGFSTPYDATAVDFLETLDVPIYKIASFELTDLPLIRRVAATGKPILMSTGMATVAEIDEAVRTARASGCRQLVLLKCTSSYPASPAASHLRTIPQLLQLFGGGRGWHGEPVSAATRTGRWPGAGSEGQGAGGAMAVQVGLSDHTLGIGVAVAAVALGASVIEKHVTLSRADGGVDAAFSLEPHELAMLVTETERAWQALGQVHFGPLPGESTSLAHRRSLYVAEDMAAGELFTAQNLRVVRPGHGLPPKYYETLLGRAVNRPVAKGTPVTWDVLLPRKNSGDE